MTKNPWLAWIALAFCAVFVLSLWVPWWFPSPYFSRGQCTSNLKQLVLGAMLYEKDFDDRLMDRDRWMDQLAPYVKNEPSNHCTVVAKENEENPSLYGYSFNSRLHQIDTNKITDPEARPMLYDSNNLARNASDPFNSLPDPGRHGTKELPKNVVAFADAHAIALSKEKAKEFKP